MVRVEIIFDSRNIDEGFLEASLQFEKGIEKTVMWYLFSKTYFQWSLHPLRFPSQGTETSGKKRETALLGARNRYALRLADQSGLASCVGWDRLGMIGDTTSECDGVSATAVQSSSSAAFSAFSAFSAAIDRGTEEIEGVGDVEVCRGYHVYHAGGVRHACLSAYCSSE